MNKQIRIAPPEDFNGYIQVKNEAEFLEAITLKKKIYFPDEFLHFVEIQEDMLKQNGYISITIGKIFSVSRMEMFLKQAIWVKWKIKALPKTREGPISERKETDNNWS